MIRVINSLEENLHASLGRIYCHALNMLYDRFKSGKLPLQDLVMLYVEGREDYNAKKFMDANMGYSSMSTYDFYIDEDTWKKEKELTDLLGVRYGERSAFKWSVLRYMMKRNFNLTMVLSEIETDELEHYSLWKKDIRRERGEA